MILKLSTLALLVSSVFSASSFAEGDVLNKSNAVSMQSEQSTLVSSDSIAISQYMIELTESVDVTDNEQFISLQNQLLADIQAVDSTAVLVKRLKFVGNIIVINMQTSTYEKIKNHSLINSITHASYIDSDSNASLASKDTYASLKLNDSDGAPVVAIMGSGVDYTHKALGGVGEPDSYSDAFDNYANSWGGFPNKVVIGGFDFASENGGKDYNPLEYAADFVPQSGPEYKAGFGTMAASLILQSAPTAKILAIKTTGLDFRTSSLIGHNKNKFIEALEFALDPNLDGDSSDAADIIVIDSLPSIYGFYQTYEEGLDGFGVEIRAINNAMAHGALVVVPSGDLNDMLTYFNMPYRGVSAKAITVGTSIRTGNQVKVNPDSAMGPTRGELYLKPDILAEKGETFGPWPSTGSMSYKLEANNYLVAAKVAATAAAILENNPQLHAAELKAAIVNTGIADIEHSYGVAQIGGGNLNPLIAVKTYAIMLDADNAQPSLNFGFVNSYGENSYSKNVLIKNLTDKEQVYTAEFIVNGDKISNQALGLSFPENIVLAPHSQQIVPVTLHVDSSKLEPGFMKTGADFSMANWNKLVLQGYVALHHDTSPGATIKMPWLIIPQRTADITINKEEAEYDTYEVMPGVPTAELPFANSFHYNAAIDQPVEFDLEAAQYPFSADVVSYQIANNSDHAQDVFAMPVIYKSNKKPEGLENNHGIIIKSIAAGKFTEAQCASNEKLSFAISTFDPMEVPVSNHFDRGGGMVFTVKVYSNAAIEASANNQELAGSNVDAWMFTELRVTLKQDLTWETTYLDMATPFNVNEPNARIRSSSLPLNVSPNGKTIITNICTDDLFHHELNERTFDEPIAIIVGTDRDTVPGIFAPILQHNVNQFGLIKNTATIKDGEEGICEAGYIKDYNDNCIPQFTSGKVGYPLADYFELDSTDLQPLCTYAAPQLWNCDISHETFQVKVSYTSSLIQQGPFVCDIPANSTEAVCYPSLDKNSKITINLASVLAPKEVDNSDGTTEYSGSIVKIAKLNQGDDDNLQWQNELTMQPGDIAKVTVIADEKCNNFTKTPFDNCSVSSMIFNPANDMMMEVGTGGSNPDIQPNQNFSVREDAEMGTVFGKVAWLYEDLAISKDVYMIVTDDGGMGSPFYLSPEGVLSIRDPSALDFESKKRYKLTVLSVWGKSHNGSVDIWINVTNANDNAPQMVQPLASINIIQNQAIEKLNLTANFSDADGTGLTFLAENLPPGLALTRGGTLAGTPTEAGSFTTQIKATDGKHTFQSELTINVEEVATEATSSNSSGGALIYLTLFMAIFYRRRFN